MADRRYSMLARYNRWANTCLFDAAAALSDAAYRADMGAFFKSMHGTLNHMLVADRLWMRRFTGEGEVASSLDAIVFEALSDLRAAREREDERIASFVAACTPARLEQPFSYRTVTNPITVTQPLAPALDHFFNHQTHHRGQAHCLLTMWTGTAPTFDLIAYQRETGEGGVTMTN